MAVLVANPVNAFAVLVWLWRRSVRGGFANGIDLFDPHPVVFALVLAVVPAHLLGDLRLGFVGVAVFIQQFHVFVGACVALLQELFVIVLVPFLLGVFLAVLLLLNGLGELPHEISHARGS